MPHHSPPNIPPLTMPGIVTIDDSKGTVEKTISDVNVKLSDGTMVIINLHSHGILVKRVNGDTTMMLSPNSFAMPKK
jgi:hypothetical protein